MEFGCLILEKLGVIKATPNQAAEMLMDNPDSALNQGGVNNFPMGGNNNTGVF